MNLQPKRDGFVDDDLFPSSTAEQLPPSAAELPPENPAMESAPPPPQIEEWPIRVRILHRPIRDNVGREVRELVFRQPSGADINRCGNPCRINQDGDVVIDERKMSLIMANLSGILSPLLDQLDPRDWNSAAYRLRSFFLPELAAW